MSSSQNFQDTIQARDLVSGMRESDSHLHLGTTNHQFHAMSGTQTTFFSKCEDAHAMVSAFLADALPENHLATKTPPYKPRPQLRSVVKEKVIRSMDVLDHALEKYRLEEIAVSYNGGKDCLVMLALLQAAIHRKIVRSEWQPTHVLDSIYINSEQPFAAVTEFIRTSTEFYRLNPVTIQSSLKEGFEHYLTNVNPQTKAIVVGIRHADPYGSSLSYEQETDHHWPKFTRIHPILHWNYVEVWDFLLACNMPYCSLYDKGYTSLGGVDSTRPNPYLQQAGAYLPAYMLEEDADTRERVGRIKK